MKTNKDRTASQFSADKQADERRSDQIACGLVDQAVEIQRTKNASVAEKFLVENKIPEHIALRVLSCAAFRRKPK